MTEILQLARLSVYPPTNGRETRIWKTAEKLSEFGRVTLATPGASQSSPYDSISIVELTNPALHTKSGYVYLWNAALVAGSNNPYDRLQAALTRRSVASDTAYDVVVCESPQMVRAGHAIAAAHDASLLLNKHNASYRILADFLDQSPIPEPIVDRAVHNHRAHEQWAIDISDAVVLQSVEDRHHFKWPAETPVAVIPNGSDVSRNVNPSAVSALREEFGIDPDRIYCVFVGSYDYSPNRSAARVIDDEIAPSLPNVSFLFVGRDPPAADSENVHPVGFVDNLSAVLALADIALCPLQEGSGTKLKMMDYLAAGLPIVTTPVGASGIEIVGGETALIRESPAAFVKAIDRLRGDADLRGQLASNAATLGESYSWDALLEAYDPIVSELIER